MTALGDGRDDELLQRLCCDEQFRRTFRRDPAAACRALGLVDLGDRYDGGARDVQLLEARELRSGLAGVIAAAVIDAASELQLPDATDPLGASPMVAADDHAGRAPRPHPTVATAGVAHTGRAAVIAEAAVGPSDAPAAPYPGDDAPPRQIAAWMAGEAQRHGLPRELPVMAALVESGLRNLSHGDRASVGYFQMQTTYWLARYPGYPDRPELQLRWFIDQALAVRAANPELAHDPQRWGEWVADIEQPAAEFRGRYADRLGDARALVSAANPPGAAAWDGPHAAPVPEQAAAGATPTGLTARTPDADASSPRGHEAVAPPLARHATGAIATAASSRSANDVQRVRVVASDQPPPRTGAQQLVDASATSADPADRAVEVLKAEAERIDDARVPYLWGGGHAAQQASGSPVTPLDCSGAVSRVLGIDPRVASAFESWGASGPGRRVTIYANDGHVLMEIDGHFWGTSGSNPGGGAGWIPRRMISDAYLARFVARHPPGQ